MTRYILFDFDGTLANSKEVFLKAYNQLAEKHRYGKLVPEQLQELRKLTILERCKVLRVPVYKLPFLATEVYGLYRKSLPEVVLYPGIKDLLTELHQLGYQLAVLSSNSEANIRDLLAHNGITEIDRVVCSNNLFGKDKLLRKFLKAAGAAREDVLYVGDELRDLVACQATGIRMVWVSWGYDLPEVVLPCKPDFVAHTPAEVLATIAQLKAAE